MSQPHFVAVDWGTTSSRLWVMDAGGQILKNTQGSLGMSRLKPEDFGRVLEESLNTLGVDEDVPVVICSMAGAAKAGAKPLTSQRRRNLKFSDNKLWSFPTNGDVSACFPVSSK